ncbi:hypothetical protein OAU50_03140 [Planctomycetota bacterium]|nr:hypothetical protein [Planctomycetota bacterium]
MSDTNLDFRKKLATQAQETFAPALNTITWVLLRNENRTAEEDRKMLYAAFASAFHYTEVGDIVEQQRAAWLLARVNSSLGNGREALRHAEYCLKLTKEHADKMADYDKAFALEAMTRANVVLGDSRETAKYHKMALEARDKIADKEARNVFDDELKTDDRSGIHQY